MSDYLELDASAPAQAEPAELEPLETPAEPQEEPQEEPHEEAPETSKKKSGVQRLKEKLQLEREERIRLEERIKALEGGKKAPEPEKPKGKPTPDQYDTQAEFLEALTDWKVEKRAQELQEEGRKSQVKDSETKRVETWRERVAEAAKKYPDWDEVMVADVPLSPHMQDVLMDSELGPDLGYYLVHHPDEARRIAKPDLKGAARELGKLEAVLGQKQKPEPKTTKAPAPPSPVAPKGSPTSARKDSVYEEY